MAATTLTETAKIAGVIETNPPLYHKEMISPSRRQRWTSLCDETLASVNRDAQAVAIGVGASNYVTQLDFCMTMKHLLALRELALYALKLYGGSPPNEKQLSDVYDIPRKQFSNWIRDCRPEATDGSSRPAHNRVVFQTFLRETTSHIFGSSPIPASTLRYSPSLDGPDPFSTDPAPPTTPQLAQPTTPTGSSSSSIIASPVALSTPPTSFPSPSPIGSALPNPAILRSLRLMPHDASVVRPKPITVNDALRIINPDLLTGTVNTLVHEHTLDAIYQALKFVGGCSLILGDDKGVWTTIALQVTGVSRPEQLNGSEELLSAAASKQRQRHEASEWTQRSRLHAQEYERVQRTKMCRKSIAEGLMADPKEIDTLRKMNVKHAEEIDRKMNVMLGVGLLLVFGLTVGILRKG